MTDSKKLAELKKAYAEIILNTAKEAAARVMASEKKAETHRREVVAAKDEALRMILRLKHLMESKAREAEAKSMVQSSKIELLEAQLGEAEDIVKDLRSDLRELQEKLEQLTKRENEYGSIMVGRNGGTHRVRASEGSFLSIVSMDSEEQQMNGCRKNSGSLASCRMVDKASDLDCESSDVGRKLDEELMETVDCGGKLSSEKSLKFTFQRKRKMEVGSEEDLAAQKKVS